MIRVRADVERKRLAGLAAEATSGSASAALQRRRRPTYARLAELARAVLEVGRPVLVDATFLENAPSARPSPGPRRSSAYLRDPASMREIVLRARVRLAGRRRRRPEADEAVLEAQPQLRGLLDAEEPRASRRSIPGQCRLAQPAAGAVEAVAGRP